MDQDQAALPGVVPYQLGQPAVGHHVVVLGLLAIVGHHPELADVQSVRFDVNPGIRDQAPAEHHLIHRRPARRPLLSAVAVHRNHLVHHSQPPEWSPWTRGGLMPPWPRPRSVGRTSRSPRLPRPAPDCQNEGLVGSLSSRCAIAPDPRCPASLLSNWSRDLHPFFRQPV